MRRSSAIGSPSTSTRNGTVDQGYRGSDMFRPAGTTPGHWLEWSRLLLQLWAVGGKRLGWLPEQRGRSSGRRSNWAGTNGGAGLFYTLDWQNKPALRQKLWWPCAEGIGAAAFCAHTTRARFTRCGTAGSGTLRPIHFIDRENGGWIPELSEDLEPTHSLFTGKPDIYHAVQACLIPLFRRTEVSLPRSSPTPMRVGTQHER
jgi:mannose/cellobiose epimerase-like protein (N-acyl-D-glucosamine 2-epimerase family)